MNLQWIGAIMIVVGCTGVGFGMALSYKREEAALGRLLRALDFMTGELQCRLTPLPELCRKISALGIGSVGATFLHLAQELENQISPDARCCMEAALQKTRELPELTAAALAELGSSLGLFDLQGQLQGIDAVRQACQGKLRELADGRTQRLRSYQTLGLCAGAALVILFI